MPGQHVDDLAVVGQVQDPRRFQGPLHVVRRDLAVRVPHGDHALAGLRADVCPRYADKRADNFEAGLLLGLAHGADDRLDNFLRVDDHRLLEAS